MSALKVDSGRKIPCRFSLLLENVTSGFFALEEKGISVYPIWREVGCWFGKDVLFDAISRDSFVNCIIIEFQCIGCHPCLYIRDAVLHALDQGVCLVWKAAYTKPCFLISVTLVTLSVNIALEHLLSVNVTIVCLSWDPGMRTDLICEYCLGTSFVCKCNPCLSLLWSRCENRLYLWILYGNMFCL